jgi:NADH-quinone oxidoreductase subunit L
MHHEQDMRNMGALRRHIPITAAMMAIGTLALTGFPFTAGYFSKDAIIEAAYTSHNPGAPLAFMATVIAAFMTSFYSWRLFFMTFEQAPRWSGSHDAHAHPAAQVSSHHADGAPGHHEGVAHDNKGHDVEPVSRSDLEHGHGADHAHAHQPHESPLVMLVPLGVLAFGAIFAGMIFSRFFIGHDAQGFWRESLGASQYKVFEEMHHAPLWVVLSPAVMMIGGFLLAFLMYIRRPELPARTAAQNPILYRFLLNKWYFDEIYDFIFVRGAKALGRFLWKQGDVGVIDRLGPDGISARVVDVTRGVVRLQTGYVYHYAFVMLIGVAAIISWYLVTGGGR